MNITELYKLTALKEIDALARGAMMYVDENTSIQIHSRLDAISDIAACAIRETKKDTEKPESDFCSQLTTDLMASRKKTKGKRR